MMEIKLNVNARTDEDRVPSPKREKPPVPEQKAQKTSLETAFNTLQAFD